MSVKEKILEMLKEIKPNKNLETVTDIVEGGYLDSFEIMNLIMLMGESFNVEIGFEEIVPENFNSVDAMASMVERLQK